MTFPEVTTRNRWWSDRALEGEGNVASMNSVEDMSNWISIGTGGATVDLSA